MLGEDIVSISLIIQIIIGLVVAFAIYNLFHYLFVTRPSRKRLLAAQRVVNRAVNEALKALVAAKKIQPIRDEELQSQTIADIWGRGVMAFEYHIPIDRVQLPIPEFRKSLGDELQRYANQNGLKAQGQNKQTFVVTDVWQLDDRLHFDIAYLVNLTTAEYIDDLRRLH